MKEAILAGLSGILETTVREDTLLGQDAPWDSLAIVCAIALLDEKAGVIVTGEQLLACQTAADVVALAESGMQS